MTFYKVGARFGDKLVTGLELWESWESSHLSVLAAAWQRIISTSLTPTTALAPPRLRRSECVEQPGEFFHLNLVSYPRHRYSKSPIEEAAMAKHEEILKQLGTSQDTRSSSGSNRKLSRRSKTTDGCLPAGSSLGPYLTEVRDSST